MIKKTKRGWEVLSHKTGRSRGIYDSKPKAQARLKQIKLLQDRFKKMIASKRKAKK